MNYILVWNWFGWQLTGKLQEDFQKKLSIFQCEITSIRHLSAGGAREFCCNFGEVFNPIEMFTVRIVSRRLQGTHRQLSRCTILNSTATAAPATSEKLTTPPPESAERPANPKLVNIVNEIATLNLLEVSELSTLLKKKLNLPETAFMPASFAAGPARPAAEEEEEAAPKKVQTSFKVKLVKFDDKQKVALIKEVKNLLEGMNLVQAKKFVESAPTIVKEDIPKDEAEKLKEALSKVGAEIEIE